MSGQPCSTDLRTLARVGSLSVQERIWAVVTKEAFNRSMSRMVSAGFGTSVSVVGSGRWLRLSALPCLEPGQCTIEY